MRVLQRCMLKPPDMLSLVKNTGYNILVVDDCAVMRSIIKKVIDLCDLNINEVMEASDGSAGLNRMNAYHFDLVIADLNMPVMNGAEMIAHMKVNPAQQDIPVITVSCESNENRVNLLDGMTTFTVHKPFTIEELRQKIVKALDHASIKSV